MLSVTYFHPLQDRTVHIQLIKGNTLEPSLLTVDISFFSKMNSKCLASSEISDAKIKCNLSISPKNNYQSNSTCTSAPYNASTTLSHKFHWPVTSSKKMKIPESHLISKKIKWMIAKTWHNAQTRFLVGCYLCVCEGNNSKTKWNILCSNTQHQIFQFCVISWISCLIHGHKQITCVINYWPTVE